MQKKKKISPLSHFQGALIRRDLLRIIAITPMFLTLKTVSVSCDRLCPEGSAFLAGKRDPGQKEWREAQLTTSRYSHTLGR
jgi:hypothetical protein